MTDLSVLMSIYSKEKPEYLNACLQSLENQTMNATEIILVEDGPISSELKVVIERYRNVLNIVSVPLTENVGLAQALNNGLKKCSFDLIARMDTDDIALPERFEKQVSYMMANPDVSASSGIIEEFNDNGDILSYRTLPLRHKDLVEFAKKRSPLSHPAVIMRRDSILCLGGYPNIYPEDYLCWIKFIQSGFKIENIDDVLVRMRTNSNFMNRRGLYFVIGEIKIYIYMLQTNFISYFEFIHIVSIKLLLRLSPRFIKGFLYKVAR